MSGGSIQLAVLLVFSQVPGHLVKLLIEDVDGKRQCRMDFLESYQRTY